MAELGKERSVIDIFLHTPIIWITFALVVALFLLGGLLYWAGCKPVRNNGPAQPAPSAEQQKAQERRLSLRGSTGSALITGAVVSLALFLVQLVITQNNDAAAKREKQNNDAAAKREKEIASLQGLILALNIGPDLSGLNATLLDSLSSPSDPGIAMGHDLCSQQVAEKPLESKVLRYIQFLRGKKLDSANFSGLWLKDVDLSHTSLRGAIFCHARLERVNLEGADLTAADLRGAEVKDSDLQFAKMPEAVVWSANFSNTEVNLETCWSDRFGKKFMTEQGLVPRKIANPKSPLYYSEDSLKTGNGHTCENGESDRFPKDQFWFVTPDKVREMTSH